ncbi:hypothetical protein BST97_11245 [Nonlabens spongiae]|uniref:Methyltransferase domain-containing protein n=1 Tax=Nonlabens spongiae TaxID=331648 RepID=A0A1W6MLN7_9FLAO|nr:class I SAM-dependent methyltransferase [Nonlabens spongiae]ARN78515.1 hypothetical protein BST97_11245 [Nonlabens spongiae]
MLNTDKDPISHPNFLEDEFSYEWHMSRNERYAFIKLLEKIKPKTAIEIGCFKGGSLEVLSKYCEKVYSFDIMPSVKKNLDAAFPNVEIMIGDSAKLVPDVIKKIDQDPEEQLEFVLIDGDHSYKGVQRDIRAVLEHKIKNRVFVVFHDSFNPICRKAILNINYDEYPHVQYVELDYISGLFLKSEKIYREMWGGLALMVLDKKPRQGKLKVSQCQKLMFDAIYWRSIHPVRDNLLFLKPLMKKMLKR